MAERSLSLQLNLELKKAEKDLKKLLADIKKEFKQVEKTAGVVRSKGKPDERDKKVKDQFKERKKNEEEINRIIKKRQELTRRLDQAEAQRARDRANAARNQFRQRQDPTDSRLNPDRMKNIQAIERAEIEAIQRIDRTALLSEQQRLELKEQSAIAFQRLRSKTANFDIMQTRRELAVETGAQRESLRQAQIVAQQKQQLALRDVKNLNRINVFAFQTQQAIEDFQFAGLRGVSNNLAFMATTLGGKAGIVAVAGLAAAALVPTALRMLDLGDAGEEAGKQLDRTTDRLDEFIARSKAFREAFTSVGPDDSAEDIFSRQAEKVREAADIFEDMRRRQERLGQLQGLDIALRKLTDAGEPGALSVAEAIEGIDRAAKAAGITVQLDLVDRFKQMLGIQAIPNLAEDLKEAQEAVNQLNREFDAALGAEAGFRRRAELTQKMTADLERAADARARLDDLPGVDSAIDHIQDRIEAEQQAVDDFVQRMQDDIRVLQDQFEDLEQQHIIAVDRGDLELAEDIEKRILDLQKEITKETEDAAAAARIAVDVRRPLVESLEEIVEKEKEAREEIEDQIKLTKERIAQENEKLMLLREQQEEAKAQFQSNLFGAKNTIVGQQADALREGVTDQFADMRRQLEAAMHAEQFVFRPFAEKDFVLQAQQAAMRRIDAMERAALRAIDRKEKELTNRLRTEREGQLGGRAERLQQLARDAANKGEIARAEHLTERAQEALDQLQDFQLGQVGQGTVADSQAALQRAQETEQKIQQSFDLQAQLAEQRRAADEAGLQQLEAQMNNIDAVKMRIESRQAVSALDLQRANQLLQILRDALNVKERLAGGQAGADSVAGPAGVPARATGGFVASGSPYMVGERGPELFVPSSSGNILSTTGTRNLLSQLAGVLALAPEQQQAVTAQSQFNFGTVQVAVTNPSDLQDLQRKAAMAAKSARIRQT